MARFFVAAILVFSLAGCVADQAGGAAVEAGVFMSLGEHVAGQGRDEGKQISYQTLVAADTFDMMNDHTIPARIFALPEDPGAARLPFEDLAIFDVTSGSGIDPTWCTRRSARSTPNSMSAG